MSQLGGWVGYRIESWAETQRAGRTWLVFELRPDQGAKRICSGCGQPVGAVHDRTLRRIRDLPIFDYAVELVVL